MSSAGPSPVADSIRRVAAGQALSRHEARLALEAILSGAATPAQIGGLLVGLAMRGETADEIAGFVEAMRAACVRMELSDPAAVDLCGTGGDGAGTINISTGAALVAAAAGARVAKHGNRSASSKTGSADVLEALGVPIDLPAERTRASIEETGFGFLFAPLYHPAMRHAAGPRKELGVRTVFNILGPLSNPAGVKRQLLGVYDDRLRPLMAEALRTLGAERAWIVHAKRAGGGLDEIGLEGPTRVTELYHGRLRELEVRPEDAGLETRSAADLRGGDPSLNAKVLEAVFSGEHGAPRDAMVLNAAAALVVAGTVADLRRGAQAAAAAIDSGRTRKLLEDLRRRR